MRNKYSEKFEEEMRNLAHSMTLNELLNVANTQYNYQITNTQLRQYLYKRQIKYKDYNKNMKRNMGNKIPLGTERIKPDGMIQVKVAPNKWEYKNRLIYEKHHNIKLTSDDYIIFLDQDRTNFDIKNLKRISRHESSILSNQKIFSQNPKVTETGIEVARLIIKTKEMKNCGTNNN